MPELLVLDRSRLDLITRGDAAIAGELLEVLVDEATGIINRLAAAVDGRYPASLADAVHHLKGMAVEIGAQRLSAAARALEAETEPRRLPALLSGAAAALAELRELVAA